MTVEWVKLALLPLGECYGDLTLDRVVRTVHALGYELHDVDLTKSFDADHDDLLVLWGRPDVSIDPPAVDIHLDGWERVAGRVPPEPSPTAVEQAPPPRGPVPGEELAISIGAVETVESAPTAPLAFDPDATPRTYWIPGDPMLVCEVCEWFTNAAATLAIHTAQEHGRRPTIEERTPITDDAARRHYDAMKALGATA